ncbi:MAG: TIGR01906 family membrane protein [Brooklawnia sp.]|jgi:integral membrane protein (TIGR01906 family)
MRHLVSLVAAIAVAAAILGGSVTAVLAARFSYPWFSSGLVNSHQLTAGQMQANYDAVINYSLFPWITRLELPYLPMSAAGAQHFAEAKDIFQVFVIGGLAGLVLAVLLGGWVWRRYRSAGFLTAGAVVALATPVLLAIPLAIDFDRAFLVFHELAFDNDLWIFDPATDPIINYLPQALFMRNAFAILVLMVLLCVLAIVVGRRLSRRRVRRA